MRSIRSFSFNLMLVCIALVLASSAMAATLSAKIGFKMVDCGAAGAEKCARAVFMINPNDYEALGVDPLIRFYYYKGTELNDEIASFKETPDGVSFWMEKTGDDGGDNREHTSFPDDHHFFILEGVCLENRCQPVQLFGSDSSKGYEYKTIQFPQTSEKKDFAEITVGFQMVKCSSLGERRCAKGKITMRDGAYDFLGRPTFGKYQYSVALKRHTLSSNYFEYNREAGNYKLVVTDRNALSEVKDRHFFTLQKVCLNYDCVDVDMKAVSSNQKWLYSTRDFPHQSPLYLSEYSNDNSHQRN